MTASAWALSRQRGTKSASVAMDFRARESGRSRARRDNRPASRCVADKTSGSDHTCARCRPVHPRAATRAAAHTARRRNRPAPRGPPPTARRRRSAKPPAPTASVGRMASGAAAPGGDTADRSCTAPISSQRGSYVDEVRRAQRIIQKGRAAAATQRAAASTTRPPRRIPSAVARRSRRQPLRRALSPSAAPARETSAGCRESAWSRKRKRTRRPRHTTPRRNAAASKPALRR